MKTLLIMAAAFAAADGYTPGVCLGALQVSLVQKNNVFPLMTREDRFMELGSPEGTGVSAAIKSLPYIRDASIRVEDDVWVFFLSEDIHLAFHHLHCFLQESEKWKAYCKKRQIKTKEFAFGEALRPLLLKTNPK